MAANASVENCWSLKLVIFLSVSLRNESRSLNYKAFNFDLKIHKF